MLEINKKLQSNNNFTKYPNKILDNILASRFGLLESKIIHAIVRRTYGYHRREAEISLRMFEKIINTDHRNIHPVIKKLVDSEIIYQTEGTKMKYGKPVYKYSINEESYHRWNTSIGIVKTTEAGINNIPIKYKKKNLKERVKSLANKFNINK